MEPFEEGSFLSWNSNFIYYRLNGWGRTSFFKHYKVNARDLE